MSTEIKIDRRAFDAALEGFEKDTGLSAHDVLVDSMRSLLKGVVRAMPPKTQGVGRNTIRNDLNKVLGALDNKAALKKLDAMFARRFAPLEFDPVGGEAAEAHVQRFRNNRGRVSARNPATVKAGPFTFSGKRYVSRREYNRILREKQAKVGQAKAGFLQAARLFGFTLPTWISRHSTAPGSAVDTHTKGALTWYLEATNAVPHAQRHRSLVETDLRKMTRATMMHMDRQLVRIAKKHSAK